MNPVHYLAGQRKRKQVGQVQGTREVGGVKCYRIKKRKKLSWINEKDIVNVEAKTETGQGPLDQNEGRNQAANESPRWTKPTVEQVKEWSLEFSEWKEQLAKQTEDDYACATDIVEQGVQSASDAASGIHQTAPQMDQESTLRGAGGESDRKGDLLIKEPSGGTMPSQSGTGEQSIAENGIVDRLVCNCASVDRCEQDGSQAVGPDTAELEFWNRQGGELEAWKKRVIRAAKSGRSFAPFSHNFFARALANDTRFFIRLGKAIQNRRKK